jgi:LysM repeat protein
MIEKETSNIQHSTSNIEVGLCRRLALCALQLDAAGKEVFHSGMKKISLWLFILAFTTVAARAQDAELTERISKVEGYVQDLQAAKDAQNKHVGALEREIADLRDKMNQPGANNYASAEDLQKLAGQVQELAKKQQADNDLILKEIEKLGKISGGPASSHRPPPNASTTTTTSTDNPTPGGPQKGYYYTIQDKDTLSAIAKAYRAQNIKVTADQILKANPGLDPKSLVVGKKIFIPAPAP